MSVQRQFKAPYIYKNRHIQKLMSMREGGLSFFFPLEGGIFELFQQPLLQYKKYVWDKNLMSKTVFNAIVNNNT